MDNIRKLDLEHVSHLSIISVLGLSLKKAPDTGTVNSVRPALPPAGLRRDHKERVDPVSALLAKIGCFLKATFQVLRGLSPFLRV